MTAGNKSEILSILCLCGTILLLLFAHYIYIWDRGRRDKSAKPIYNINGKRVYVPPPETGIHVVLSFIIILLMSTLGFIYETKVNENKQIKSEPHSLNLIIQNNNKTQYNKTTLTNTSTKIIQVQNNENL